MGLQEKGHFHIQELVENAHMFKVIASLSFSHRRRCNGVIDGAQTVAETHALEDLRNFISKKVAMFLSQSLARCMLEPEPSSVKQPCSFLFPIPDLRYRCFSPTTVCHAIDLFNSLLMAHLLHAWVRDI